MGQVSWKAGEFTWTRLCLSLTFHLRKYTQCTCFAKWHLRPKQTTNWAKSTGNCQLHFVCVRCVCVSVCPVRGCLSSQVHLILSARGETKEGRAPVAAARQEQSPVPANHSVTGSTSSSTRAAISAAAPLLSRIPKLSSLIAGSPWLPSLPKPLPSSSIHPPLPPPLDTLEHIRHPGLPPATLIGLNTPGTRPRQVTGV